MPGLHSQIYLWIQCKQLISILHQLFHFCVPLRMQNSLRRHFISMNYIYFNISSKNPDYYAAFSSGQEKKKTASRLASVLATKESSASPGAGVKGRAAANAAAHAGTAPVSRCAEIHQPPGPDSHRAPRWTETGSLPHLEARYHQLTASISPLWEAAPLACTEYPSACLTSALAEKKTVWHVFLTLIHSIAS